MQFYAPHAKLRAEEMEPSSHTAFHQAKGPDGATLTRTFFPKPVQSGLGLPRECLAPRLPELVLWGLGGGLWCLGEAVSLHLSRQDRRTRELGPRPWCGFGNHFVSISVECGTAQWHV